MGITPTDFIDDLLAALMNSAEIDAQRFCEPARSFPGPCQVERVEKAVPNSLIDFYGYQARRC